MQDKIGDLIKKAYREWNLSQPKPDGMHPDEQDLVCFLEHKLKPEESERIKAHLIACDFCAGIVALQLKLAAARAGEGALKDVPCELLERVKGLVALEDRLSFLEIALKLKEKALEILSTTGDVLVGQELVPAPLLRSRSIKDFKDEITILKEFNDIRVEVKVENKSGKDFNLTVVAKEKATQKTMKNIRIALLKDDLELESYLADSGSVVFEHVLLGNYRVEISTIDSKLASVLLDIKV